MQVKRSVLLRKSDKNSCGTHFTALRLRSKYFIGTLINNEEERGEYKKDP